MVKCTILYHHPTDSEAFERYYNETHLPLASRMQGVERLELTRFVPGSDGVNPLYYRMAELYFPDENQLQTTLDSPEGRTAIADFANFATGGVTILLGLVFKSP